MFAKLRVEKISSTVCQGLWKEQKRNSEVYETIRRKENPDDYHAIEKSKIKRTEVTELYFFVITRKINLPQFFLCKVHLAENRTFLFIVLTLNTASYFNVISFCEGKKWKRKLLQKERKLSAVRLVSTGENEVWTRRT